LTPEKWVAGVGNFIDEEKEAEGTMFKMISPDEKKKEVPKEEDDEEDNNYQNV